MRKIKPGFLLLVALVLIACALRGCYALENSRSPDYAAPQLDPQFNDYWARALVTGYWTPPPHADDPQIASYPYGRPPAYPWILALIYKLFGLSYHVPRLIQGLLGLVNILCACYLARRVIHPWAGGFAALMMAIAWPLIYFEGEINAPVFVVLLSQIFFIALYKRLQTRQLRWTCLAGSLLGVFALFRPNVLLVALLLAPWFLYRSHRDGKAGRRCLLEAGAFLLACVAIITPVVWRNYAVSGDFVLISSYGGVNAYIGNNPQATGVSAKLPDLEAKTGMRGWNCFNYPKLVRALGLHLGRNEFSMADASAYFYAQACAFWREQPLEALSQSLKKGALFWGPAVIADSKEVDCVRRHSSILPYLPGFSLILACAATGFIGFLCLKNYRYLLLQSALITPLALFILGYFLSVLPYFVSERYRIPVLVCLIPFAAMGAYFFLWSLLSKRLDHSAFFIAVFLLCYCVARLPLVHYEADTARWHFHQALAYAGTGQPEQSMAALNKALHENPDHIEARMHLGYALAQQGDRQGAQHAYKEVLALAPHHAQAHNNLGLELAQRGAWKSAEDHYRRALDTDPLAPGAHANLAYLLLETGRSAAAAAHFQKALALGRPHAALFNGLGFALARQGKAPEAAHAYQQALRYAPDFLLAYNNYGNLLSQCGAFVQAEEQFRQALQRFPNDPMTGYNLANMYAAQGRLKAAEEQYLAVLEIDKAHHDARNNLGLLYTRQQRYEEAIAAYRRILQDSPDYANAWFNLGNIYGEQGRIEEAIRAYDKALEAQPDFEAAKRNRASVAALLKKRSRLKESGGVGEHKR